MKKISHNEMRFLRRDLINKQILYWHEWASRYNYSYGKLTFVKNTVRSEERKEYGRELKNYS